MTMTPPLDDLTVRERRLCEVIAAYYQACEDGQALQLRTLMELYPDLAAELRRYLAGQDKLRRITAPLRTCDGVDHQALLTGHEILGDGEEIRTLWTDTKSLTEATAHMARGALVDSERRFGDYELLEELAVGGMGVVYKARQVSLNRLVALKLIRVGEFGRESDVRRFRAEAETVADLDHPNIVSIYEVGEHKGYHFFSMKLIEGGNLAAHLDRYASDPRAAARLVATLARALHHVHQHGVLHRDLKPSNILLDSRGEPLIADFGLAKRLDATTDMTATGAIVGTPPYFAPELTLGRKGAVTTATDVYGLGAIIYALLTGRAPFQADSLWELIEKVKDQPPEPPRRLNPRTDVDLQTICLKCLEKDPGARYPSARALADDLERWLTGAPIQARPCDWRHRGWLWCHHPARQHEAGVFAMVAGVLLTLWAALGITLSWLGMFKTLSPGEHTEHISYFVVLAFLPMILIGWHATQGKSWAIRSGLIHSAILMTANKVIAFGLLSSGATRFTPGRDPLLWMMSFTLFYLAVAFIVGVYAVANISLSANRAEVPEPTRTQAT